MASEERGDDPGAEEEAVKRVGTDESGVAGEVDDQHLEARLQLSERWRRDGTSHLQEGST